jgi:hypothetical protein
MGGDKMLRKLSFILKPGYVVGFVLLVSMLVVWPVWGQTMLKYFAPREVEQLTLAGVTFEATPSAPRMMELEHVEELAGFSLLAPTYLPSGCRLRERFYLAKPGATYLNYSCVSIVQQKGETIQRPFVGEGSIQAVTVGDKPATYVDGIWMKLPGEEKLTWQQGIAHDLVFERDGLVIRLSASSHLSKAELIRIAESLK